MELFNRLLRIVYYLLYQPFAWAYDWTAAFVSCGEWQRWIEATLPYLPGPRVLELGHGPGHLQIALKNHGIKAAGLDISRPMSRLARNNLRRAGHAPELIIGYAQTIGFSSASFDQVAATFPSEYIFDSRTLAEARRLLKPGGRLVILPGAWLTGRRLCHRLLGWLLRGPAESDFARQQPWQAQLAQAGFAADVQIVDLPGSRLLLILASLPVEKATPTS